MNGEIILFPYSLVLRIRHAMYDHNFILKSKKAEVPTICVGNVTVGGTGKTPHTEMLLDMLMRTDEWGRKNIAVLSRGYKRKTRGFQLVEAGGRAAAFGDEPLQIKNKYPWATVAVDKNRVRGCDILAHPEKTANATFPPADLIILDDAFQYRKLKADVNIVLVDYNRPVYKDRLLPLGGLRDLAGRIYKAQIIIVTKCPLYIDDEEKEKFATNLGIREDQRIFFTSIRYSTPEAVFPECNTRYMYSKKTVMFTGIAKDTPFAQYLSDSYRIVRKFSFGDHHKYGTKDINTLARAARKWSTASVVTTEKDAQRVRDVKKIPLLLKERLFQVPIKVEFMSDTEADDFRRTLLDAIR